MSEERKPQPERPEDKASQTAQDSGKVKREIDRMARQLEGMSKNLKRVRDSL